MNTLKYIAILCLLPFMTNAQTQSFGRTYSDKLPEAFVLDAVEIRDQIYQNIPEDLRTGVYARPVFAFADVQAFSVKDYVASGDIYSDWDALEKYLNEIFQKIIPEELKDDKNIHVYVAKDGDVNASVTASGLAFFNVRLMSEVENEATIAGILAHELAHYYLQHSLDQFIKNRQGAFDAGIGIGGKSKRKFSEFSIQNELDADALSMKWLHESGYHVDGVVKGFEMLERLQENRLMKTSKLELKASTHPLSEDRIAAFDAFKEKHKDSLGEWYLVSEEQLKVFAKQSKVEVLKFKLAEFDYGDCLELAFRYHIQDVRNSDYIYYLMESIRRLCYLNSDKWAENFITNRFYEEINADDPTSHKKVKMTKHLFQQQPDVFLSMGLEEKKRIKARFYWSSPKFVTNEQAFEFFFKMAKSVKADECLLTYALSLSEKEERNQYLKDYLSKENISNRSYAESLLNDNIYSDLPNKKLMVVNEFIVEVRQKKSDVRIRNFVIDGVDQRRTLFNELLGEQADRKVVYLEDFKKEQLNDYKTLSDLEQFSTQQSIKDLFVRLHILGPEYWTLMKRFGVREIEFINGFYLDNTTDKKTLESYKAAIALDMNTVLQKEKGTKFLYTLVSTVRIREDGILRLAAVSPELKLVTKKSGYTQVVDWFEESMKQMDGLMYKKDGDYRKLIDK